MSPIEVTVKVEVKMEGWEWRSLTNEERMVLIQEAVYHNGAVTYIEEDVD